MTTIVYTGIAQGDAWAKVDKRVLTNRNLSDGAVRLYYLLVGHRQGKPINDNYIVKTLGISSATLFRRKAELYAADLVKTIQLAPRVHMMFIGTSCNPASAVEANWNSEDELCVK